MFITAKWNTVWFMAIVAMSGLGFLVPPVLGLLKRNERMLPFKSYIPYSVSNLLPYLATYLLQLLVMFYGITINISLDALIYGFTIQACAQVELICHRLTVKLKSKNDISSVWKSDTNDSIIECVRHHLLVSLLVKKIQALFIWTIMIFISFSMIIVCTSIFILSKARETQERHFI